MTLEQEFESFIKAALKDHRITAFQYKLCERFYFAGCITMMDKFLNLPDDEGDKNAAFSSLLIQLQDIREKI